MASYRRPKGAVVRPIPDWNLQKCCYGGVQNGFAAMTSFSAGCTNQDTQGGSFIIWDCTVSVGRFDAAVNPTVQFMNLGTFQGAVIVGATPAVNVDPTVGAYPMVFDSNYNLTTLEPNSSAYVPLSGEGTWRWTNNFPMAIVRPGWSLLLIYQATQAMVGFAAFAEYSQFP